MMTSPRVFYKPEFLNKQTLNLRYVPQVWQDAFHERLIHRSRYMNKSVYEPIENVPMPMPAFYSPLKDMELSHKDLLGHWLRRITGVNLNVDFDNSQIMIVKRSYTFLNVYLTWAIVQNKIQCVYIDNQKKIRWT